MDRKKLYEYLSRLSKKEWKSFQEFLSHPLLGASELYVKFLKAFHQMKFEGKQLVEEDFQEVVYGNRDYDERHMNRHYTLMLEKLYDFLAYQAYRKDDALRREARILALETRGWTEASDELFHGAMKKLRQNPMRPASDYLGDAKAAICKISLRPTPSPREQQGFFQEAIDALDQAYAVAALELATKAKNYDLHQRAPHQTPRWLANFNRLDLPSLIPTVLADAMQEILALYQSASAAEQHFERAQGLLTDALAYLHVGNRLLFQELFNHLISHAARHLKAAPQVFRPALGKVYRAMLDQDLLLVDGFLSPLHLLNVVDQVWKSEPLETAQAQIEALQDKLPVHFQESARDIALAMTHFHHGDFPQSRQLLEQVTVHLGAAESIELSLKSKAYLLMANMECGNYEGVETTAQSLRTWLKRHRKRMSSQRHASYHNFSMVVSKLASVHIDRESVSPTVDWRQEFDVLLAYRDMQHTVHVGWVERHIQAYINKGAPRS